jgi:hypothetical protein
MSERLALPDGYKKGGRVKGKKSKKAKTPKKRVPRRTARMAPVATGPMPTTGMGSVVFGAPQNPSYFRAVGPQQEFANIPDVLKGLKEGQQNIMRELERRRAQEAADRMFASQVEEEEVKPTPRRMKKTPMSSSSASSTPMEWSKMPPWGHTSSSTRGTPLANYDFSFATPLNILLPNTLNPLERQRSSTPDMMTPMGAEFQAPGRAVPLSYEGPLSSKEAMAQPYRGADESLPPQEVASGEQMVPQNNTLEVSSSSAFAPLQASMPESQSDSLERPILNKTFQVKRPVPAIIPPGASRAASAPRARVGPAPGDEKRAQVMVMTSDELLKEATRVGIKNAKRDYTGPGRSERLKADILARF